jgi:hypothetical protein
MPQTRLAALHGKKLGKTPMRFLYDHYVEAAKGKYGIDATALPGLNPPRALLRASA